MKYTTRFSGLIILLQTIAIEIETEKLLKNAVSQIRDHLHHCHNENIENCGTPAVQRHVKKPPAMMRTAVPKTA